MAQTSSDEDERIDIREWCRHFKIGTVTARRWEDRGLCPRSHRINGRRYWFRRDLHETERRLADGEQSRPKRTPPKRGEGAP